jgi:hypothetical protein
MSLSYLSNFWGAVQSGNWVFLKTPSRHSQFTDHVLLTRRRYNTESEFVWMEMGCIPEVPVCSYCAMPKQGDKSTLTLERISNDLLDSLESLATDQSNIGPQPRSEFLMFSASYVPVIVVNREIIVCEFEPSEIDLSEGILKEGSGKFVETPFVRFRKNFTTRYPTEKVPMNLEQANKENERTIYVVHALSLPDFLRQWDIDL